MSSQSYSEPSRAPESSADAASGQRRIKLTIKPLKLKATASTSTIDSPGQLLASDEASSSTPRTARNSITIRPLKLKLTQPSSSTASPLSNHQDEEKKPRPKIKIKPPKPVIVDIDDTNAMDVDEVPTSIPLMQPAEEPRVEVVPPAPILTPPPPPPPALVPTPPPAKIKAPRPIKLKPLKEVLQKLIAQIKRKDDYAFFLEPVDLSQVPGYSDVVKYPMDFGTMTEKVEKGRYRALEQFKDDFLLVTSNAKAFNPPPSLYHSEASKIEAWGLDQISKASAQVIEFEADWTIDVVADEASGPAVGDVGDDSVMEPVAAAGETPAKTRSPSVMSSAAGAPNLPVERGKRRGKRIPIVTESWEEGGHLPGFKYGIGAFPPSSDFAALMLGLKLRGKRFRTKKERLKREKEGPPAAADGSLDYTEMENPFTVLQRLVPEPLKVPHVIPLINTYPTPADLETINRETSTAPEPNQAVRVDGPVALPSRAFPAILEDSSKHSFANPLTSTSMVGTKRLRHWTITRNPPRSTRTRDEEEDGAFGGPQTKRRRVEHTDYGAFASLLGTIAAENGIKADDFEDVFGKDEKILEQIRQSIEVSAITQPEDEDRDRLLDADEYIREVVYGGIDGLAYFRSLAEFVGEYHGPLKQEPDTPVIPGELGMPVAQWVTTHIVDPLTLGNYATLRAVAETLARSNAQGPGDTYAFASEAIARYLALANEDKSAILTQMRELEGLADPSAQIDIAPLLHKPEELFLAENEWAGREREQSQAAVDSSTGTTSSSSEAVRNATIAGGAGAVMGLGLASVLPGQGQVAGTGLVSGAPSAIEHALTVSAEALRELGQRILAQEHVQEAVKDEDEEDAVMRRTRLTLIALAKRAPINRIARLPPELVPLHIRHIVPTLGS